MNLAIINANTEKTTGLMKTFFTTILLCLTASLYAQDKLPVFYLEGEFNNDTYEAGKLKVVDTDGTSSEYRIKSHYRGSGSKKYDKKSFALKFQDESGQKLDVSFFGMRSDNRWILDAMACDYARMRNRVSFDLWNEFSNKPYVSEYEEKAFNGIRGTFVEVYLNNKYFGLYCLNEKVDRKQLQLKDLSKYGIARGAMYKGEDWGVTQYWEEIAAYDDQSPICEAWESEYPDAEDDGKAHWKPIADMTSFVATSDKAQFVKDVEKWVDLPVWNDHLIFLLVTGATDNGGKNTYTYIYDSTTDDKRIGVCPWDVDAAWGRRSDGTKANAEYNRGLSNMLYTKLFMWQDGYFDALKKRYSALREKEFGTEHLKSLFTKYFDLFDKTGVAKREKEQWNNNPAAIDFETEKKYIFDWIEQRIAFVDNYFGYIPSGIESVLYDEEREALKDAYISISGEKVTEPKDGQIYIRNGKKILYKK